MSDSSRDLTKGSIIHAILQLALPMIVGVVAVMSVSLVDTYFVGKLGTDELAALAFTFPVSLAIASLSSGLGAGAASVVSRAIGAKNTKNAKRLSTDSLILASVLVSLISVIGLFTIEPLFSLLGAQGAVLSLIERYMWIWYMSMPFLVIPMVANAIIRSVGDAFWPSMVMIAAAAINVIVTPILIFGWGPIPALNIEGAAYGTLIARVTTLIFALYIAYYREELISLARPALSEVKASFIQVLKIGIPAGVGSVVNPVGIAVVTAILAGYGASTVAAFGVATRIEFFACIPMLALSAAIGPIAGQNWGANNKARVLSALKTCYVICIGWSVLLAVILYFIAEPIAAFLSSNDEVSAEAALYLSVVSFSLVGYGVVIVSSAAFNSLGRSVTGLSYYLMRSAVLYVPLSLLASFLADTQAIYMAIAVSNAVAGVLVGSYSIWWLNKAEQFDCEPLPLGERQWQYSSW
jgi:putative MATE family efflux protein